MLPEPRRISSRNTFFFKRIFPLLWFGAVAAALLGLLLASRAAAHVPVPLWLGPIFMLVIGYVLMRVLVFDLADEVCDEGDALRVRFGANEERVPLGEIINVSYAGLTNPPRVTLTLRHPGRFGREITFSPQHSWFGPLFSRNALVDELIARVDAARRR